MNIMPYPFPFPNPFGNFIGNLIKKATIAIGKKVTEWLEDKLDDLILGLPPGKMEDATVDEIKKINEALKKYNKSYEKEAEEYDKMAKEILEKQYEKLTYKLIEINQANISIIVDNYILENIERNFKEIKKSVDKIYSKKINEIFSLNNKAMTEILALSVSKEEKKAKLKKLGVDGLIETNRNLKLEIKEFMKQQENFIKTKLNSYMSRQKKSAEISIQESEKILKNNFEDKKVRIELEEKYDRLLDKLDLLGQVIEC